jgi:all-trans-retinol dehydrogenase (NAD+)
MYLFLLVVIIAVGLWYMTRCTPYALKDRHVLITGAGQGIGRRMALLLARKGVARIVLWDINEEALAKVLVEIEAMKSSAKVTVQRVDVGDSGSVTTASAVLLKECGHIDVLINNAGVVSGRSMAKGELTADAVERTLRVNTLGHFHTVGAFLPRMVQRKEGYIVTVASCMGMCYSANLMDYCASKWAALGAHHSLRVELNGKGLVGIKTLAVCPFAIATGMFDGVFEGSGDTFLRKMLFPILQEEWVASRIIQGIEAGERFLVMPKVLRILLPVAQLLPIALQDVLVKLLGSERDGQF